jgi:hypothetical protein
VPRTLEEALAFSRAVVAARMAPAGLDTPEACMIAILHGLEVGLTPLSALQRIAVIGGRPTIWGDGAMALVRASGLAVSIDERVEGTGFADWVAICTVRRKGEAQPVERRFSVEDARRARLWGRPGPWTDYPRRMLQMRARAFALRDVFADVLGGLYLREEVEGVEMVEGAEDGAEGGGGATGTPPPSAPPPSAPPPSTPAPSQEIAHSARPRVVAPPPPGWGEPAVPDVGEADAVAVPAETASTLEETPAQDASTSTVPPLPALTRRRTVSAREAQRLRYAQGWAVRRPRTLQPKPTAPQPARRVPKDSVAAEVDIAGGTTAPSTHEDVVLFDDALSCARDRATLDEIVQEFTPRLSTASREIRAAAARVLKRHRLRVAELEQPNADGARRQAGGHGAPGTDGGAA